MLQSKPLVEVLARAFAAGAASFAVATPVGVVPFVAPAPPAPPQPSPRPRSGGRVGVDTARATPRALASAGRATG